MQSFTLDLKTLLHILSRQKQHGFVQAEIPSDKFRFSGPRQILEASILLDSGIIRACTITYKHEEHILEGEDALHLLFNVGVIEWNWQPRTSQERSSLEEKSIPIHRTQSISNPPVSTEPVPHRTSRGEEALQTLPREYRKVLALVDGQRSVHKLAAVLAMREEDVVIALRTLQSWGLIS